MKCTKCKDIAHIPYIKHELMMYKAYVREQRLKLALAISNGVWLILVTWLILR